MSKISEYQKELDCMWSLTYRCACGNTAWINRSTIDEVPQTIPCGLMTVKEGPLLGCGKSMWLVDKTPPLNSQPWYIRWPHKLFRALWLWRARRINRKNRGKPLPYVWKEGKWVPREDGPIV